MHTAILRGSDKAVALKVLKPGVEDVLTADLNFLFLASRLLELINPALERTSLAGIVEDVRSSMLDEVRLEGCGLVEGPEGPRFPGSAGPGPKTRLLVTCTN